MTFIERIRPEVLQLNAQGFSEADIAAALHIHKDAVYEAINGVPRELYSDLRLDRGQFHTRKDA